MFEVIINEEYGYRHWKFYPPSPIALLEWWVYFKSPAKHLVEGPSSIKQLVDWGLTEIEEYDFKNDYKVMLFIHDNDDSFLILNGKTYRWGTAVRD